MEANITVCLLAYLCEFFDSRIPGFVLNLAQWTSTHPTGSAAPVGPFVVSGWLRSVAYASLVCFWLCCAVRLPPSRRLFVSDLAVGVSYGELR
jgi:hypothetical protein